MGQAIEMRERMEMEMEMEMGAGMEIVVMMGTTMEVGMEMEMGLELDDLSSSMEKAMVVWALGIMGLEMADDFRIPIRARDMDRS